MASPSTTTDNPLLALIRRQAQEYATKPYVLDARSTRVLRYDQLSARWTSIVASFAPGERLRASDSPWSWPIR
jgi:hypothetical protein